MLNPSEPRLVSYFLDLDDDINEDSIQISITISKGAITVYTDTLNIDIVQSFEIIRSSFPEFVPQGEIAYLILEIQNNKKNAEAFSFIINGESIELNINKLNPGLNRIVHEITPTINPYEIGIKEYHLIIKDSTNEIIMIKYLKTNIELSTFNLIVFYILPVLIPIGIIIFFKNKDLKHKLLRRWLNWMESKQKTYYSF